MEAKKWHRANQVCPVCQVKLEVRFLEYARDGELKLTYFCEKCETVGTEQVFASQLQDRALWKELGGTIPTIVPVEPPQVEAKTAPCRVLQLVPRRRKG